MSKTRPCEKRSNTKKQRTHGDKSTPRSTNFRLCTHNRVPKALNRRNRTKSKKVASLSCAWRPVRTLRACGTGIDAAATTVRSIGVSFAVFEGSFRFRRVFIMVFTSGLAEPSAPPHAAIRSRDACKFHSLQRSHVQSAFAAARAVCLASPFRC